MGVKDDCYLLPVKQQPFDNKLRSKSQNSVSNVNVEKVMKDVVLWKPYYYRRRRSVSFFIPGKKGNVIRKYYMSCMNLDI